MLSVFVSLYQAKKRKWGKEVTKDAEEVDSSETKEETEKIIITVIKNESEN